MATELIQRGNPGYSKQQMQIKKASGTSPVPVAPSAPIVPVNPNTQVASTIGGKQYNAGGGLINPADIRPTISAESIGTTPALNVPTAQPQTKTAGTNEFVTSLNQTQKSEGQAAVDRQFEMDKAAAGKSQTDLQLAMGDAATQGTKREELYKQYGVDQLSTSVAEIQNRIEATERSRLAQIQQLEQNKQGLFGGALQDEINRINRDFSRQQADDAITLSALTRNFTNMSAIADRQLEDYMAPIKANVEFQKELFKTNQSNFTQTQRDALKYKIAQDEKKQSKIEEDQKNLSNIRITALKSASEQGAPSNVIEKITKAKTPEEIITSAGAYGGNILEQRLKQAQLANVYSQIKERQAKSNDVSSGVLTDQQLKQVDASPQGKKLSSLSGLYQKSQTYKNLVDTYGFKAAGEEKAMIDRAYADLQIAYKEAANLGALTGPDVGLIQNAIKPSSGAANYLNYRLSGGKAGVSGAIDAGLDKARNEALTNYKQLVSRNPKYSGSEYIQSLITPFAKDYNTYPDIAQAKKGEIIQTEDGILLEALGNGQFSPL